MYNARALRCNSEQGKPYNPATEDWPGSPPCLYPLEKEMATHCSILAWKIPRITSVTQSCPTLCNPMDFSTPGVPVHHQLPEFTQTQLH